MRYEVPFFSKFLRSRLAVAIVFFSLGSLLTLSNSGPNFSKNRAAHSLAQAEAAAPDKETPPAKTNEPEIPPVISSPLANIKFSDPLPANIFVELAKVINPTVVNISTMTRPRQQLGFQGRPGFPGGRDPFWEFFEEFMGPNGGGPRGEQAPAQSLGTGFIIDSDGLILTNNHVVEAADLIKVQLINHSEKFHDAKIVGTDKRYDIALIRINIGQKLPHATLGNSGLTEVGEWVAAFGNPYGHSFSMSKGIISAKGRQIKDLNALPFLQTDASINPGNSGGPLVNMKGQVIGVNTAIDARAQGIGFAIPIDEVKKFLPELKDKGKIVRGYIGVQVDNVTIRAKQALGLKSDEGALIVGVIPNAPAAVSGLKSYDVVTKVAGHKILDAKDLIDAVQSVAIGSTVPLEVFRNGKKETISVVVTEPPGESQKLTKVSPHIPKAGKQASFNVGFTVADYSEKLVRDLQIPAGTPRGPIVSQTDPGSSAARNGLRAGDVILDVNKERVSKASEVNQHLVQGSNVLRVAHGERVSLIFVDAE